MGLDTLFASRLDLPSDLGGWDGRALPSHGGVWLLTDGDDRPIQLASCQNLRRSLGARLARPEERTVKADLAAIARRVWWRAGFSQFETALHYWRIARTLYPRGYRKMVGFGPAWFVQVDPTAAMPELTVTKDVYAQDSPVVYLGPFATRRDCGEYVEVLQDVFDLCRRVEILRQAPHGKACAYFEMGRCPAPCDGSIGLGRYREMMAGAVAFGARRDGSLLDPLRAEMAQAAGALDFERAAVLKKRLDRAAGIDGKAFRFVADGSQLRWLAVQRSHGTSWVRPFFVICGTIQAGEEVRLRDLADAAPGWVAAMRGPGSAEADRVSRAEQTWLLSHFLFKGELAGGMYLPSGQWDTPDVWVDQVRERFAAKRTASQGQAPGDEGDGLKGDSDDGR